METKQVKEIIEIFEASGLSHMEIEEGNLRIKLEKPVALSPIAVNTTAPIIEKSVLAQPVQEKPGVSITSPLVGTFYRAKSPKDKPYINVGDRVSKGDVICMIEAMKTMNEIKADKEGIVKEICVENGDMVEYDQVLILLGDD